MPTTMCLDARTGVASARLFSAAEARLEGVDSEVCSLKQILPRRRGLNATFLYPQCWFLESSGRTLLV